MGKSVNKVILLGYVGKAPDVTTTGGGSLVAKFSLATNERQKDGQGNWQDKTEWHNLLAFNKTAEIVRDYVKKGSKIYAEGKLQTSSWNDKNTGDKRYRTEVLIFDLALLDGRSEDSGQAQSQPKTLTEELESAEDEVPF